MHVVEVRAVTNTHVFFNRASHERNRPTRAAFKDAPTNRAPILPNAHAACGWSVVFISRWPGVVAVVLPRGVRAVQRAASSKAHGASSPLLGQSMRRGLACGTPIEGHCHSSPLLGHSMRRGLACVGVRGSGAGLAVGVVAERASGVA